MKGKKITTNNYFEIIAEVGFENLPLVLKQSHMVIMTKTVNGRDWSKYKSDEELKSMMNLTFEKLGEFLESRTAKAPKESGSEIAIEFLKEFLKMVEGTIFKEDLEVFLDKLQKAISSEKIKKTNPYAKEVTTLQSLLVKLFNEMPAHVNVKLKQETRSLFEKAIAKSKKVKKPGKPRTVKKQSNNLDGVDETPPSEKSKVMRSTEFTTLEFTTIGFKDKWLQFIGDPAPGFTAMVFGKPKMGKSYLCVDFAGYLARNHGSVLYVAKEEQLDATLQKKLKDKNVAHENLFVAGDVPEDLSGYKFVILDSVNKLGYSPHDLTSLKAKNPGVSFIYIFQTTKEGKFRGTNEFQHDVDVVIEVPEQGKAVQFGRFNQGGEIDIFGDSDSLSGVGLRVPNDVSMLAGLSKKKEPMENAKIGKELTVKIAHNSWGDVIVLKHGKDWHAILQPDDIKVIAKLRIWESATIKDEQGYTWEVQNNGEGFNIKNLYSSYQGHFSIDRKYLNAIEKGKSVKNEKSAKEKRYPSWTSPEFMNERDHQTLRHIYDLYSEGKMKEAMDYACNVGDTAIREEIPVDIWKKMGGQLTPSGEEKLRAKKRKAAPVKEATKPQHTIAFTGEIKALKSMIEKEWNREFTIGEFYELIEIAKDSSLEFYDLTKGIEKRISEFLKIMQEAIEIWDKRGGKAEQVKRNFDPELFKNRTDNENPRFVFTMTSTRILVDAMHGDFDILYMVRRELANRGLDRSGKWVGFDKAKEIHNVEE